MTKATIYWIMATLVFLVSMIMSWLSITFSGGIFVWLMLGSLCTGWVLWFIGLICKLLGR